MDAPVNAQRARESNSPKLIVEVVEMMHATLPPEQASEAAEFARQYYGQVAPQDLAERSRADLYGAALCH